MTRHLHSIWLTAAALLLSSGGCSLLYNFDTQQCKKSSDCWKLGLEFANTTCQKEVCVLQPGKGGSTGAGGGTAGDGSSGGTIALGGASTSGGASVNGGAAGGTNVCTNESCQLLHGPDSICRNNACINLTNDDCPVLIPRNTFSTLLKRQDVIMVGGYAAMNNPANYYESQAILNWDLVFDHFNKATFADGLPGYQGSGRRPLVGLVCKTTDATSDTITRTMQHLTETVQVSSVLSTLSANFLYQAWSYVNPVPADPARKPVFFMATGSADTRLATLEDSGLVWQMLGDPQMLAAPVVALLKQIEPVVNAARAASGTDDPTVNPLRVTLVSSDEPMMYDLARILTSAPSASRPGTELVFNGKRALDNGDNFHWVGIESSKQHDTPNVVPAVTELATNPPHVIVVMATSEFVAARGGVINSVENTWPQKAPNRIRPYYLMSHLIYNTADLKDVSKTFSSVNPPLDTRVVGVNYAASQEARAKALYDAYYLDLKRTYVGDLPLAGTENQYDGAYYLLYSIAAAATSMSKPTAEEIGYALKTRVISDSPTADSVNVGYDALSGSDTGNGTLAKLFQKDATSLYRMSLYGTMGPPDFDLFSGTRISTTSAWCIQQGTPSVWAYQPDGLIFNAKAQSYSPASAGIPTCLQKYCNQLSTEGTPTCLPSN